MSTERRNPSGKRRNGGGRPSRQDRPSELAPLQYLKAIVESSEDAIIGKDLNGIITLWNRAAERLYGYKEEEAIGQPISMLMPPEQRDQLPEIMQSLARGERVEHFETVRRRKDGELIEVMLSISPINAPDGRIIGASTIAHENTARKRSDKVLRDSEARFRATFDNVGVGMAHVDLDGRWMRFNDRLCAITGYTREELAARTFRDITHPDDLAADLDSLERLTRGEIEHYSLEKRYIRKDGSAVWVTLTVAGQRDNAGRLRYYISAVEDITERKRAQQALEQSESRLRTVIENLAEGLIVVDADSNTMYWNRMALEMYGYKGMEEALQHLSRAREVFEVRSPYGELLPLEQWPILRMMRGERVHDYEVVVRHKERDWERIFSCGGVLLDDCEPKIGLLTMRDVTERRRAEHELRRNQILLSEAEALSHSGAWDWDLTTNQLTFSDEWMRIHGCTERNMTPKQLMEIAHPDDREVVRRSFMEAQEGLKRYEVEHRIVRRDTGEVRVVRARGKFVRDVAGNVARVYGFAQDVTDQKRAQEELRTAKEQYRLLVENQTDMVAQLTREGKRVYVNPNYLAFVGKTEAEVLHSDFAPEIHPDDIARVNEAWQKTFEAPRFRSEIEARTLTPMGWRWTSWRNTAILDQAGQPTGAICVGRDTTKLKEAEEALRLSEERVRLKLASILEPDVDVSELEISDIIDTPGLQSLMEELYKLAHIPVGILDLKGKLLVGVGWQEICTRFHRVNPTTCQYCLESDVELSMDVPVGTYKVYACKNNMWDVVTPIHVGGRHVANVFLGQFFFEEEVPDREFFRQQARKYGFDEGDYLAALDKVPRLSRERLDTAMSYFMKLADMISKLSYSNIKLARSLAERDSLTAALQKSEERFRLLAGLVPQLIWTTDAQGLIDYVNERWTEYTGQPLESALGRGTFEMVHPDDVASVSDAWAAALEGGHGHEIELRLRSKTGEYRWFLARGAPVRGHDGRIDRWFGTCTDINDFKQAQDALVRTEKLATVGRMAATIAHEINNPLESVMNSVYLASTSTSVTPEMREILGLAEKELERVAHITRQTLGFYREAGVPKRVHLPEVVNGVLDLFAPKLVDKKIEVERRFADGLDVRIVPGELRQVVSNLISNAMDAMTANGKIYIRSKSSPSISGDGPMVRLTVADTGSGIDAEHMKKIFEPFFTTKESIGTGLGLWVSKEIVTKHGGWIRVRSQKGRGTVFSLCLPRAGESAKTERVSALNSVRKFQ